MDDVSESPFVALWPSRRGNNAEDNKRHELVCALGLLKLRERFGGETRLTVLDEGLAWGGLQVRSKSAETRPACKGISALSVSVLEGRRVSAKHHSSEGSMIWRPKLAPQSTTVDDAANTLRRKLARAKNKNLRCIKLPTSQKTPTCQALCKRPKKSIPAPKHRAQLAVSRMFS